MLTLQAKDYRQKIETYVYELYIELLFLNIHSKYIVVVLFHSLLQ